MTLFNASNPLCIPFANVISEWLGYIYTNVFNFIYIRLMLSN